MRHRWHPLLSGAIITTLILPTCWTQQTFGNDINNRYKTNSLDPFNNRYSTPRYGDPSSSNRDGDRDTNRDLNDRSRGGTSIFGRDREREGTFDNNNVNREFGDRGTTSTDRTFNIGGSRNRDRDRTSSAFGFGNRGGPNSYFDSNANVAIKDATYFIIASRMVRPGAIYRVFVTVADTPKPLTVRASIARDGVEMSTDSKDIKANVPETLLMRVPPTSVPGEYKLKVEGTYNTIFGGIAFVNETNVEFSQRSMTIFVQTDKPVYMQGETVRFRTIPITTELKGFDNAIDVFMLDPNGHIMRRWLSRQSNLGSVSLSYKMSDQPVYGEWRVRVVAQGQVEEGKFEVEEYYQTRFEVNVTMPAFFFNTDPYVYGRIMANFTSGAPVFGNMTLKATIRPIGYFNPRSLNQFYRVGHLGYQHDDEQTRTYNARYNPELNSNPYGPNIDQNVDQRYQSNVYQDQYVVERVFNFDEEWPFWVQKPETVETYDRWGNTYKNQLPYLRFFNGTYEFRFPMQQLEELVPTLAGMEVLITAKVGERYYDEIIEGYSIARIYNSSVKVNFLGGTPQIFKPMMPFSVYIVAEYHDGSPLPIDKLFTGNMEISGSVESRSGRRDFPTQLLQMSEKPGIWELKIDIRNDLALEETKQSRDFLNEIQSMRLLANFIDLRGERASAELLLMAHHSPQNQHIKVLTSTQNAKVGEYIVFHVQSNFHIQNFHYIVMSKGLVLLTGLETMKGGIRTMSVTLSAEMAPVASIVVWHMGRYGNIVADSLTFPVNGISRNNFTFYINNRKARTGEKVEVAIYGEPGAYIGLSGIDSAFYTMQAGNELTYAKVITKMSTFDEQTNGTFKHTWISHQGDPDELVYFPASTFGVDANRTFEYAGLVVFTDGIVPRRYDNCAITGQAECLNGRCYRPEKKCDGFNDCEDGTDELECRVKNETLLTEYRKYRFNRIQRHYDNVWLWRDVNIGPHGRFIFTLNVPDVPARWMVSAFSVSPSLGYGMITKPVEYVGVQPFFINVEMPSKCRQGEQVGVRVTVFNYMTNAIEATVVLHGSSDYKFVHVEADGIVRSYNPKTSFGEHQFFVYLPAQESSIVYLPIVPTRLGEISITVHAATLLGKDEVTRKLLVEADGLPQYRHQSILLDLSSRAYVFQYMHVNVTETPIIPYEVDRYYVYGSNKATISVVGDVVGPIFPTMPVNATSLIHLPMDSAEQNMFSFAANLYTMMYMRLINQRNKTTYKHAFHYLNVGYQRQLSYLMPDGSFSLFRSDYNQSASSVWLTAYCARVFQEANFYEWENFIYIDPKVIQKNVAWLLRYQTTEGSFYETTWSPDRKTNESSRFPDDTIPQRNISLTAHVLITLASVRDLSGNLGGKVALATQRAIGWLDRNLLMLKNHGTSYEVAIVAYALMLAKAPNAEQAFRYLSENMKQIGEFAYWGDDTLPLPPYKQENQKPFSLPRLPYENDAKNIETTAYGLLTYVSRQEILVEAIVRWLNSQRLLDGSWASTQDTGIAMKALIEYTVRSRIRDVSSLTITVEATALQDQSTTFYINDNNLAQLQTLEIPNAWGTVKVQAKGAGYAILQMSVQYNVDIEEYQTKPPIPAFELYPNARFHGRNQSHITYTSCQRWTNLNESIRSGMAVLDVTIPTGYIIQQQKLDAYILSRRVRNLQRARFQESKVLFYFDFLDHDSVCVNFTVERWYPVANMSRYLPIRVYDYYSPERFNESIFDAYPTYLLNICEVCGSSQCPYCSIYNVAFKSPVSFALILTSIVVVFIRHFRLISFSRWFEGTE